MRRKTNGLWLSVEHRNAPSVTGLALDLITRDRALALEIVERAPEEVKPDAVTPDRKLLEALAEAKAPLNVRQLRVLCQMRTNTVCDTLAILVAKGQIERIGSGYRARAPTLAALPLPASPRHTG